MSFKADMRSTLIGSLPLCDHEEALGVVLQYTPEIPLWVQLPRMRGEDMMVQFLPGIPCVVEHDGRVFVDTSAPGFEEELLRFYEEYLAVQEGALPLEATRFVLTPETAPGFFVFCDRIPSVDPAPVAVKGQMTGPVTLATALTDQNRRALFYDDRLRDVVVKTLAMKGRWQAERLTALGVHSIVFVDEPGLAGFGTSAFATISGEDVMRVLGEVIEAIREGGALAGIHVCANTDWSLVLESSADIVSFDAHGYFDRLILYEGPLKGFLKRGGILAWGIVPTAPAEKIDAETATALVARWEQQADMLANVGIDMGIIRRQSLITPSCGTGSLPLDHARKVLQMTQDVSRMLREKALL